KARASPGSHLPGPDAQRPRPGHGGAVLGAAASRRDGVGAAQVVGGAQGPGPDEVHDQDDAQADRQGRGPVANRARSWDRFAWLGSPATVRLVDEAPTVLAFGWLTVISSVMLMRS